MAEPRTLQPLQFFRDVGDARSRQVVQDFRPNVSKGDPLGDYAEQPEDTAEPVSVTVDPDNEPARPEPDASDAPDPDEDLEEDDDQSGFDDLLTSTEDKGSIAADGTPDGG